MTSPRSAAVALLALLAGCDGRNAAQPISALPPATLRSSSQTIVLTPAKLNFGLSVARTKRVAISRGSPPYSLVQSNAEIAGVTQPQRTGRSWWFDVTPVASGTTIVTVRDASGAVTALPVNQQTCVPPTPEFGQLYPRSGATNVATNIGVVYVSEPSGDPMRPYIHQYYARLVGSDGSVVIGSAYRATTVPPPPGSATPPPSSIFVRATIPRLRSGITYRLLYPTKRSPCIGPLTTGSFST